MDKELARINMIKQQFHVLDVIDHHLLNLLASTPREDFVPSQSRELAFVDTAIPLPHEQQMLMPKEEARLLQSLAITPTDVVLEIGTGSGYLTALLAKLANHVITVDIFPDFVQQAEQKIHSHQLHNVTFVTADAATGWHEQAPYDMIIISGSLPFLPVSFMDDLRVGGKLFAIVGEFPVMTAMLVQRYGRRPNECSKKSLFETVTPMLINATQKELFQF